MTKTRAQNAAETVKHWLTEHPGRAAAARFPIDELWTLLDERSDMIEAERRAEAQQAELRERIDRLHEAVLAADERPEGWSATVADAAAEIRQMTPPAVAR